ncbi:MAG: S8 family serine peptidase [Phycisphaerae bacterium]
MTVGRTILRWQPLYRRPGSGFRQAMMLQSAHYRALGRNRMWRPGRVTLALMALVVNVIFIMAPGCLPLSADSDIVPDQLIVSLRPGATQGDLMNLLNGHDAGINGQLQGLSAYLVGVDPRNREQLARSLRGSPLVEEVLNNRLIQIEITPNDPDYTIQWFLQAVHVPQAWTFTTGSGNVLIAVLDTGVDTSHPDLADKLKTGANTFDTDLSYADTSGHGTAVAGIIGAQSNNADGVASVAPGCPILPIRVTGLDNKADSWSIAAGIALAVNRGAKVINISFAPLYENDIVLRQARMAWISGCLTVIAAGNGGSRVEATGSDEALFIGAIDQFDKLASFSTSGDFVDLVAPGMSIYTTTLGKAYAAWTGTSFAAPIASGVAALIWSANPSLRPATVRDILLATARDLGPTGWDEAFAFGCVDAATAVELAARIVEQQDTTPPNVAIVSPSGGTAVSSLTVLQVEAGDTLGIAEIVLYVDQARKASDSVWPYGFVLDPGKYATGMRELRVKAIDLAGNVSEAAINVTITSAPDGTPPIVDMTSPRPGTTVRGMVSIVARATDDRALSQIEILIDGMTVLSLEPSDSAATVAHNWNTADPRVSLGSHTIIVRATDTSGNAATSSVNVTVAR